jgi:hypothetical protein
MSSQQSIPDPSYRDNGWVESHQHSAFNQTRNSLLGLRVVVGDFSFPALANWMSKLMPDSGAGLWISPFRGLHSADKDMSIDLVYLDADGRVIDLVMSFPHFLVSPSSQPAASVLALPLGTISSSDTHRGDLLIVCATEELKKIQGRVGGIRAGIHAIAGDVQGSVRPNGKTLLSPGVKQTRREDPAEVATCSIAVEPGENTKRKQNGKSLSPLRSRLVRWFSPSPSDRRKAAREPIANLAASFWTGGGPTTHGIRDISSTGLFVITSERWYPGTVIRMTLTKADTGEGIVENSICVCAEAVRWGNDGVGLRFVASNARKKLQGQCEKAEGADREQLDRFLKGLLRGDQ